MSGQIETKYLLRAVDGMTAPINSIKGSMRGLTSNVVQSTSAMSNAFSGLRNSILSVNSAAALFVTSFAASRLRDFASQFTNVAAQFEKMQVQFSSLGAPNLSSQVIGFAKENPIFGLQNTQEAFVKLYASGINPTSKALQNLVNASSAFGASTADMQKALYAITQMMGKGVINSEELKQQLSERIPSAARTMARELGYANDDMASFWKDIEQGRISAVAGLTALFDGWGKDFDGMNERMKNTWLGTVATLKFEWDMFVKDFMSEENFSKAKELLKQFFKVFEDNKDMIKGILNDILDVSVKLGGIIKEGSSYFKAWRDLGGENNRPRVGSFPGGGPLGRAGRSGFGMSGELITDTQKFMDAQKAKWAMEGDSALISALKNAFGQMGNGMVWDIAPAKKGFTNEVPAGLKNIYASIKSGLGEVASSIRSYFSSDTGYFLGKGASAKKQPRKMSEVWKEYQNSDTMMNLELAQLGYEQRMGYEKSPKPTPGFSSTDLNLWDNQAPSISNMERMRQGFQTTIDGMIDDFKKMFDTFEKIGAFAAKTISTAMANSFNDFFIDAMEGRLKQFKDYLLGFFKEIGAAISRLLSQYLAQQLLGSALGGMGFGGGAAGAGGATGAGGSVAGNSAINSQVTGVTRMKAGGGATSTPSIQIINNSGTALQGSASTQTNDIGETVMVIVLDAIGRNKGGSRDMLRGMLAT